MISVDMLNFEGLEVGTVVSDEQAREHPLFDSEAWMGFVYDPKYLPLVIVQRSNGQWCVACWGGFSLGGHGSYLCSASTTRYIWTVGPDGLVKTVSIDSQLVRMPRSIVDLMR